jgi:hypothetical protein
MKKKISSSAVENAMNSSGKWTPGPWVYDYDETDESRVGYLIWTQNTNVPVARVSSAYRDPQREHIARLISAAPDLLKALEACEEIMRRAIGDRLPILKGTYCEEEDWQAALRKARSAIAKAKGVQA